MSCSGFLRGPRDTRKVRVPQVAVYLLAPAKGGCSVSTVAEELSLSVSVVVIGLFSQPCLYSSFVGHSPTDLHLREECNHSTTGCRHGDDVHPRSIGF